MFGKTYDQRHMIRFQMFDLILAKSIHKGSQIKP